MSMMKTINRILVSAAIVLPGFVWMTACGFQGSQKTDLQKAYLIQPAEQHQPERSWKDIHFEILAESDELFGTATSLFFMGDGVLFGDHEEMVVRKFDLEAGETAVFGEGRGSGPGEFQNFYNSIFPDSDGNIWVNDMSNARITIVNTATGEWEISDHHMSVRHAIPLDEGRYLADHFAEEAQVLYSSDHQRITGFEPFLENPQNWDILMQGAYAVADDFNIIRANYFTGDILKYSPGGDLIYFRRPVEPLPAISVRLEDNPNDIRDKAEIFRLQYFTEGISLTGDEVHLLISRLGENRAEGEWDRIRDVVDVYDIERGDYLYSYRLPEEVQIFAVQDSLMAAVSDETGHLVIWQMRTSDFDDNP
jgi:hypothetical protein